MDDVATVTVNPGDVWSAEVDLAGFEEFASDNMIAEKFVEAGFVNCVCTGDGSTRHVQGMWPWTSASRTIALANMDRHLVNLRKIQPFDP